MSHCICKKCCPDCQEILALPEIQSLQPVGMSLVARPTHDDGSDWTDEEMRSHGIYPVEVTSGIARGKRETA